MQIRDKSWALRTWQTVPKPSSAVTASLSERSYQASRYPPSTAVGVHPAGFKSAQLAGFLFWRMLQAINITAAQGCPSHSPPFFLQLSIGTDLWHKSSAATCWLSHRSSPCLFPSPESYVVLMRETEDERHIHCSPSSSTRWRTPKNRAAAAAAFPLWLSSFFFLLFPHCLCFCPSGVAAIVYEF